MFRYFFSDEFYHKWNVASHIIILWNYQIGDPCKILMFCCVGKALSLLNNSFVWENIFSISILPKAKKNLKQQNVTAPSHSVQVKRPGLFIQCVSFLGKFLALVISSHFQLNPPYFQLLLWFTVIIVDSYAPHSYT